MYVSFFDSIKQEQEIPTHIKLTNMETTIIRKPHYAGNVKTLNNTHVYNKMKILIVRN